MSSEGILFSASRSSALQIKMCSARGSAFSVKVVATHDNGAANSPTSPHRHLIDAAFLKRLPDGRSLRESMALPTSAATLTSTHTLTSTQCAMDSPIIGTLSKPLSIAVKTVPKDVMVSDAERYPLILQLSDVVVVENLPVPMHVSIHALAAANLAPRTAPPFQCIWEVCESPGLDGQAMEPGVLPAAYQKHKFWQSDDAAESSAIAAAQSAGFTAAASFEGARPGSVFKNGPIGLGYYLDAPPTPDPSVLVEVDKSADSGFLLPIALGVAAVVVAVVAAVILRRV